MSRFYVGQKVVCLYSIGGYKKGEIYKVTEITICECGQEYLACGLVTPFYHCVCSICMNTLHTKTNHCRPYSSRFAPIEEYSDSKSIAKSLVKELQKVDIQKIKTPELV